MDIAWYQSYGCSPINVLENMNDTRKTPTLPTSVIKYVNFLSYVGSFTVFFFQRQVWIVNSLNIRISK